MQGEVGCGGEVGCHVYRRAFKTRGPHLSVHTHIICSTRSQGSHLQPFTLLAPTPAPSHVLRTPNLHVCSVLQVAPVLAVEEHKYGSWCGASLPSPAPSSPAPTPPSSSAPAPPLPQHTPHSTSHPSAHLAHPISQGDGSWGRWWWEDRTPMQICGSRLNQIRSQQSEESHQCMPDNTQGGLQGPQGPAAMEPTLVTTSTASLPKVPRLMALQPCGVHVCSQGCCGGGQGVGGEGAGRSELPCTPVCALLRQVGGVVRCGGVWRGVMRCGEV